MTVSSVPIPLGSLSNLENVVISPGGGLFFEGWIDDAESKLVRVTIDFADGRSLSIDAQNISRVRRGDVEASLGNARPHMFGYWCFFATGFDFPSQGTKFSFFQANSACRPFSFHARAYEDVQLREIVLTKLVAADYFGNRHLAAIISMGDCLGGEIVKLNRAISRRICSSPYVEEMGRRDRKLKGSIIVCLYGKPEFFFLQNALFSGLPGIEDYEFIYVCNSPELSERLLHEAKIAQSIYGLTQTLVLLPGNAGFGAANNIATRYANSDRLLIVNPDVFPRDSDWAQKHTEILASRPQEQTELFGVPLYYDNGSLMHAGMYFEVDSQPTIGVDSLTRHHFARVEHYGKGAPPETRIFRRPRAVPAVTGAFMSVDRQLFERIDGFTEDFVFGHYEDADLCLKALMAGTSTWLHDIGLFHLEGKGSTRLPSHEGGSLVNRWLFTNKWGQLISERLRGPDADLSRFAQSSAAATTEGEREIGISSQVSLSAARESVQASRAYLNAY